MNCYKLLKVIIPIIVVMTFIGCDFKLYNAPEVGEGAWREYFIATMNIDGSDVELLRSSAQQSSIEYARPYFVRDLAGSYEDEVILIDMGNKIDIMSLDGNYRRTIIDSLGGVQYFNQDRTKMLICHDYKVYLCSVDGSEVERISPDFITYSKTPSFSFDEKSILFSYTVEEGAYIIEAGIIEYSTNTEEHVKLIKSYSQKNSLLVTSYSSPAKIDDDTIVFIRLVNEFSYTVPIEVTHIEDDFRKYNLLTGMPDIIFNNSIGVKYSNCNEYCIYGRINLLYFETNLIKHLGLNGNLDYAAVSTDNKYLMLNEIVYDIQADSTIFVEDGDFFGKYHHVKKTDMNLDNTKLVGIVDYLHY